jgi:hypothetical protein
MRIVLLGAAALATAACAHPAVKTAAAPSTANSLAVVSEGGGIGYYMIDGTLVVAPPTVHAKPSEPFYIIDGTVVGPIRREPVKPTEPLYIIDGKLVTSPAP